MLFLYCCQLTELVTKGSSFCFFFFFCTNLTFTAFCCLWFDLQILAFCFYFRFTQHSNLFWLWAVHNQIWLWTGFNWLSFELVAPFLASWDVNAFVSFWSWIGRRGLVSEMLTLSFFFLILCQLVYLLHLCANYAPEPHAWICMPDTLKLLGVVLFPHLLHHLQSFTWAGWETRLVSVGEVQLQSGKLHEFSFFLLNGTCTSCLHCTCYFSHKAHNVFPWNWRSVCLTEDVQLHIFFAIWEFLNLPLLLVFFPNVTLLQLHPPSTAAQLFLVFCQRGCTPTTITISLKWRARASWPEVDSLPTQVLMPHWRSQDGISWAQLTHTHFRHWCLCACTHTHTHSRLAVTGEHWRSCTSLFFQRLCWRSFQHSLSLRLVSSSWLGSPTSLPLVPTSLLTPKFSFRRCRWGSPRSWLVVLFRTQITRLHK